MDEICQMSQDWESNQMTKRLLADKLIVTDQLTDQHQLADPQTDPPTNPATNPLIDWFTG